MLALIGTLAGSFAPLITWGIKLFVTDLDTQKRKLESFYAFVDAAEETQIHKVNSQIALKKARRKKQMELLEEKRQRELKK